MLSTNAITEFAVLIRHEGYACRVRVASIADARWVLDCLSKSFIFRTSDPFEEHNVPDDCVFCVAYGSQPSRRALESLIAAIPGARLEVDRTAENEAASM